MGGGAFADPNAAVAALPDDAASAEFRRHLARVAMWAHRTGANPPSNPTADLCTSRPAQIRAIQNRWTPIKS